MRSNQQRRQEQSEVADSSSTSATIRVLAKDEGGRLRKTVSQLGTIRLESNGWRVTAGVEARLRAGKLLCRNAYGPTRLCKRDAEADLKQARTAKTREEYRDILRQLHKIARSRGDYAKRAFRQQKVDPPPGAQPLTQASLKSDESREVPPQTEKTQEAQWQTEKSQNEEVGGESMKRRSNDLEDAQSRKRGRFEATAGGKPLTQSSLKSDDSKEVTQPTEKKQEAR